jgi:osmotically-inducible protein OsmY
VSALTAAAGLALAVTAAPARAQATDPDHTQSTTQKASEKAERTGDKVEDAWILTKVKSKFVGEDALKDSDINVDVSQGVVTLKGTVVSEAGRARALQIARDTDGVHRVVDELTIGIAANRSDRDKTAGTTGITDRTGKAKAAAGSAASSATESAKETGHATKHKAHEASEAARDKAGHASHATKDTASDAGGAVTDSWITTKVKASFVGVDTLEGSDIDVDTNDHVVTLKGTVRSEAAKDKAASLAHNVKGVTSVNNELKVAPR